MTREEVEFLSYHEMFTGFRDLLLAHDAEQRSIIDEQVEENRGLRADVGVLQTANADQRQEIAQLTAEISRLRKFAATFMDRMNKYGQWRVGRFYYNQTYASELQEVIAMAEQALKEHP